MDTLLPSSLLPTASTSSLSPLLSRLLELHSTTHLQRLSQECKEAIESLPEEDRPTTYEGLLDVARYCIDDAPGWSDDEKCVLIGGHPRIGDKVQLSESSKEEQKIDTIDETTDEKLRKLNFIFEWRYPGLRYVTYVAGRPRSAIVSELEGILGIRASELDSLQGVVDPASPGAEARKWAADNVKVYASTSAEWHGELGRGLDALFEIAADRAGKITNVEESVTKSTSTPAPAPPEPLDAGEAYDAPFLTLDRFGKLVQSSPLLTTFFRIDLPTSFYLVPPPPPQETPRELLATLAAVAVTGGGGGDATRKRVKGLLGGLWGEVADRAGKVTGRETRTGPRSAFGREEGLRGEEMRAKGLKSGTLASTSKTATSQHLDDAEENLKLATQRLTDVDRSHFVIDEPALETSSVADTADGIGGEDDEEEGDELEIGLDSLGLDEGAAVQPGSKGKEAEIAKATT